MKRRRHRKPPRAQPDLFAPRPLKFDEEQLMRRLQEVVDQASPAQAGMSRAAMRRLMTPLPPITVPR